jgi:hypothetical protein
LIETRVSCADGSSGAQAVSDTASPHSRSLKRAACVVSAPGRSNTWEKEPPSWMLRQKNFSQNSVVLKLEASG